MTGLRIGEILAMRTEDLDLKARQLLTRWDETKGDRDEILPLHEVVVDHLRDLQGQSPLLFPWPHDSRTLWVEFGRIQREAGIHLPCRGNHRHTPACHVYSFHDFRRAFATVNAPRMRPEALQRFMRHMSFQTTNQCYINPMSQMEDAVTQLFVPECLQEQTRPKEEEKSGPDPEVPGTEP
jgi:integrase